MASERFTQLIKELKDATVNGKIRWMETTNENTFRVGLGDGLVRIQPQYDREADASGYAIYLVNRHGRIVDEFESWVGSGPDYVLLRNLYQSARGSALNIDEVIDSMLSDLKAGKTRDLPSEDRADEIPF